MSEKNPKTTKKLSLENFFNDPLVKEVASDIDPESVKKMLDAGKIDTQLKIEPDKSYTVRVKGKPTTFKSAFGQTMSLPIEYDNMRWSLIVPKSLKIQLITSMIRKNLTFVKLIGKHLNVIKSKGDTKDFKDAMLYRCEILD